MLKPKDAIRTQRLPLDEIPGDDATLGELLRYWRSLREGEKLTPKRKALDILQLKPVMGFAHIVDCSEDHPAAFTFRLYGSDCTRLAGKDLSKMRLGEVPSSVLGESLMSDYLTVKTTRCPSFHKMIARINWRPTSWTRVILPLANDQGQVAQLLVAVNRRPLPEMGALSW